MCIRNFLLVLFCCVSLQAYPQTVGFSIDKKEGCSPLTVNFKDTSTTGPGVRREWDLGDGKPIFESINVGKIYGTPGKFKSSTGSKIETGYNLK